MSLVQQTQQEELNEAKSKLKKLFNKEKSRYNINTLEEIELNLYEDIIYVPRKQELKTIEWYHHHLNHPGSDWLYKMLN